MLNTSAIHLVDISAPNDNSLMTWLVVVGACLIWPTAMLVFWTVRDGWGWWRW